MTPNPAFLGITQALGNGVTDFARGFAEGRQKPLWPQAPREVLSAHPKCGKGRRVLFLQRPDHRLSLVLGREHQHRGDLSPMDHRKPREFRAERDAGREGADFEGTRFSEGPRVLPFTLPVYRSRPPPLPSRSRSRSLLRLARYHSRILFERASTF